MAQIGRKSDARRDGGPALEFVDVSFSYPKTPDVGDVAESDVGFGADVLSHVSLAVPRGAFCLVVGTTGSGKTTLLRLAKPEVAPVGDLRGTIRVLGRDVRDLTTVQSASGVGFVFQSPDNQLVCDTVWHEMAFGLENLATPVDLMRRRVAETCYFFGIEPWFHRSVESLSGGQRQVLALASVTVMRPDLLLLDEPTSMLDPIAEKDFLHVLFRLNRELGLTVVVATHRPAPMVDYATMALRVSGGGVEGCELESLRSEPPLLVDTPGEQVAGDPSDVTVSVDDVWFSYGRQDPWVLRGCSLEVGRGEVRALVGANGCGKSTLLGVLAGSLAPRRGKVRNDCSKRQALLPQSPKALLVRETVEDEVGEWVSGGADSSDEVAELIGRLGLGGLERRHPYDLSGGQQQLVSLAKLLVTHPKLLLLDEPTKGLDLAYRRELATIVRELSQQGTTVILATHDLSFARQVATDVSMLFDGDVSCTQPPAAFFSDNIFYQA